LSKRVTRSYYAASNAALLSSNDLTVLGALAANHGFALEEKQKRAWLHQIAHFRSILSHLPDGFLFLEFAIPRMGKRADAILINRGIIFVIEYKVGATEYEKHAIDQAIDYALDLKNFHVGSHSRTIVPILVATSAPPAHCQVELWKDGIVKPILANQATLADLLVHCCETLQAETFDAHEWAASPYKPTPTIIEAAQALYRGHAVEEISRSEAGAENLSRTADYIADVIETAKAQRQKAICFVTGVPGSGKTLAGLNIANTRMKAHGDEHCVFLSGNGPLVTVLREALALDEVQRTRSSERPMIKKDALRHASSFIQNIHHFRDDHLGTEAPPIEKVVIFDEAQRAWTKEQTSRFMREKRGLQDFAMSEPAFLLSVMDHHADWCVVICLIGGGQEINTGEAGLEEWLAALKTKYDHWHVYVSDQLSNSDFLMQTAAVRSTQAPALHLAVSVRSFRAEALSQFIAAIIAGNAGEARNLNTRLKDYPICLTRDVEAARLWLRRQARGTERTGLVASSNGLRLKPYGIHVRSKIDPADWFLAGKDDVRSSYALEDAAIEFDIQGLELDWAGLCWDANLRRADGEWKHYNFRGTRWDRVKDPQKIAYLANSYRVLLTRARQGMVIFVPPGDGADRTRQPSYYDETVDFLSACGIPTLAIP
jgi:hypothetical protein